MNRTRCLDTIEAVGLRAISRTIKKSDHTTIRHKRREQWHASMKGKNNDCNDQHCRGKVARRLVGKFKHLELRGDR